MESQRKTKKKTQKQVLKINGSSEQTKRGSGFSGDTVNYVTLTDIMGAVMTRKDKRTVITFPFR